ncbi:CAP domain-containing protein [uncultured Demequina sp.]|uniref:CAP domain-containing protein n=1 Tax=uncultured Demequina sp. TaxID=693499 RepID=UPI0025EB0DED|nr:CAP domain-containing protein [uncultured Demequina sp.]
MRSRRARTGALAIALTLGASACASTPPVEADPSPSLTIEVHDRHFPAAAPSASPSASDADGDADASASPTPVPQEDEAQATASEEKADGRSLKERAEDLAQDLFALANKAREADGEDALEWSDCAEEQALDRAKTARGKDELAHEDLTFECTAQTVGENLVRGDGPAGALHQLWMDSEDHRENILRSSFDEVGVACVAHAVGDRTKAASDREDIGGWVCSQMFYG